MLVGDGAGRGSDEANSAQDSRKTQELEALGTPEGLGGGEEELQGEAEHRLVEYLQAHMRSEVRHLTENSNIK